MIKSDSLVYEYAAGYITLKAEGYFLVRMKDDSFSTVETVRESHEIMTSLCPEGPIYILADAGHGSDSEEGIYDFIARSEFGQRVKAQAVVVHELATRLMGNLFLRFIKNRRHIRLFSKEDEALAWLLSCMASGDESRKNSKKMMLV